MEKLSERIPTMVELKKKVALLECKIIRNCPYPDIVESLEQECDLLRSTISTLKEQVYDSMALQDKISELNEQLEKIRWYDLGCQGKMDLLPLIEKAQRAESAEAEITELKKMAEVMDVAHINVLGDLEKAEARVKELTEAYDKVYDELTYANQAILNHEENKYVVEDLAKTYTRIRDAEDRLSKAQELVEKWRSSEVLGNHLGFWADHAFEECADELESVLKGDEANIGNENKQSVTDWLIENALKGNNNNALIDVIEGRTKSFKNTEELFKDLDGVSE